MSGFRDSLPPQKKLEKQHHSVGTLPNQPSHGFSGKMGVSPIVVTFQLQQNFPLKTHDHERKSKSWTNKKLRTHPSISHQEEIGYLKSHDGFSGFKWMDAIHERDNIPTYAKISAVSLVIQ